VYRPRAGRALPDSVSDAAFEDVAFVSGSDAWTVVEQQPPTGAGVLDDVAAVSAEMSGR
jgi:hypothetical protein